MIRSAPLSLLRVRRDGCSATPDIIYHYVNKVSKTRRRCGERKKKRYWKARATTTLRLVDVCECGFFSQDLALGQSNVFRTELLLVRKKIVTGLKILVRVKMPKVKNAEK